VKCWGNNVNSQLGNGLTGQSLIPTGVNGVNDGTAVALGASHTCVLRTIGDVKCFGNNNFSQLGNGNAVTTSSVVSLGLFEVVAITAGNFFTCVSNANSEVNCWGAGGSGQIGNGATANALTPTLVSQISYTPARVARTTPSSPQSLIETSHNATSVSLSWSAPSDDGGAAINDYLIEYLPNGGSWTAFADGTSTNTAATITGLNRGLGYQFRVTAMNAINSSSVDAISSTPFAVTTQIIPADNPAQVRTLSSPGVTATSVTLVWTAPDDDGGRTLTDYLIEFRSVGGSWTTFVEPVSTATIAVVTSLTQGVSYEFRVSAISANGTGSSLQLSGFGIPATVSSSPIIRDSEIVVTGTSVQVLWDAPYNGGVAITDYEIEINTGAGWATFTDGVSANTSAVISGLSRGTVLRVRVRAVNAIGVSSYSYLLQETMIQIAPGRHGCSVGSTGSVWCWGLNTSGEVGDGTRSNRYEMMRVPRISNATKVAVGFDFSCALLTTSEVMCWGANGRGQLGNGTSDASVIPQKVIGISTAVDIDAGLDFACAVLSSGVVQCWGQNNLGQLGNGNGLYSLQPVIVGGLSGVAKIATASGTACALLSTGSARCWGKNNFSQIGNGLTANVTSPTSVKTTSTTSLTGLESIDSDNNADVFCGIKAGSVVCWGANNAYQRGTGNTNSIAYASIVPNLTSGVLKVAVGSGHSCALRSTNGAIWCWGFNVQGASSPLSAGRNVASPTIVVASGATDVLAGEYVSCSYSPSSGLSCWGWNGTYGLQNPDYGVSGGPFPVDLTRTAVITRDAPSQPSGVQTTQATQSSISLSWTAPTDTGGTPIFDYVIEAQTNSGPWGVVNDGVGTSTSFVHTGLIRGADYLYRVSAINESDLIGASTTLDVARYAVSVPSAPTNPLSPSYTASLVNLSWTAPSDDGGRSITDYVIEYMSNGGSWTTFNDGTSTATSTTVTGLAKGTSYSFRISAVNDEGVGLASSNLSVTPATLPDALVVSTIEAPSSGSSVIVNFSLSANGGRALDSIQYRLNSGSWQWASQWTATSATIPGLVNGQDYTVEVRAGTAVGFGPESNAGNITPATVPTAPVVTSVNRPVEGSKLSVNFNASDGRGRSISTYEYSLNNGSTWLSRTDGFTTESPLIVSQGLTNGTSYSVTLRAKNLQGDSATSNAIIAIPGTTATAPNLTRIESGDRSLGVVFISPSNSGGFAITNYEYSSDGGATWITRSPVSTVSPWTIGGLTNGNSYNIQIRALNVQGAGSVSNSSSGVPAQVPSSPAITSISRPVVGGSLVIDFLPPSGDGGSAIVKYQYSVDGGLFWQNRTDLVSALATPMTLSNLNNGTSYLVSVRAVNAQGSGVASQIYIAVPATVPSAPSSLLAETPTVGQEVDVYFDSAMSNGSDVTGYEYSTNDGLSWQGRADGSTIESPLTIDGLTNGTLYFVRVRGVNSQGSGQPSDRIATIPATIPGRAAIESLDYGESRVYVNVGDIQNGGSVITSYAVSVDGEENWYYTNSASTSFSIGGLVNGETYPVSIRARNRQGYGESSAFSYVTIGDIPEAVTTGAADVTASTVRLEGQVNANYVFTSTEFQLSTTSNFSSIYKTVTGRSVSGSTTTYVSVDISDIPESTTFFYRMVGRNSLGVGYGATLSFKTNGPLGITANRGSIYTNSTNISVGTSWPRGSTAVILSNDGGFGVSTRFNLSESLPWTLQSSGNERLPKTVYAKFVLADGSRSSTYTDDIILDETAPIIEEVTSGSYDGEGVSIMALVKKMLSVKASDANSGIAKFEIRSSTARPSIFINSSTPNSLQHSIAVSTSAEALEVRVFDRAGNASAWKSVKLTALASSQSPTSASSQSPTSVKTVSSAVAKLTGTTAKVTVSVPSTLAKTCISKVVKGKKTSVCTPVKIVVSVSGGGSKTVTAKTGSNAISVPKVKKGSTVIVKVNGKIIQKIKL